MKITTQQENILSSLICERLTSNITNNELLSTFSSTKGSSLVNYLQKHGISEDSSGKTAYYIIKTPQNEALMFFSIKCGALFDDLVNEDEIFQDFQHLVTLVQAISNTNNDDAAAKEVNKILKKYHISDRISFEDILNKAKKKKTILHQLLADKDAEDNKKILRVLRTQSGIELVHFCTNDNMKEKWKEFDMGHPMGETLFWRFIAPKFFEVQEIVGCEYVFLFAADLSEDGSLVNYYDVALKFQKRLDVGTNKPFYDFCCDFMCQEINDMKSNRDAFFDNFNIDAEDVIA